MAIDFKLLPSYQGPGDFDIVPWSYSKDIAAQPVIVKTVLKKADQVAPTDSTRLMRFDRALTPQSDLDI